MTTRKQPIQPLTLRTGQVVVYRTPCPVRMWLDGILYAEPPTPEAKRWVHMKVRHVRLPYVRGVIIKPRSRCKVIIDTRLVTVYRRPRRREK